MNKNKLTLVCTSNDRYIKPLLAFLESIHKNSRDINIVARLVNVSSQNVDYIKMTYPDVEIITDNVSLSDKRDIVNADATKRRVNDLITRKDNIGGFKGVGWLYSQEAAYCSNIKYNTIKQLLDEDYSHVVYMDVDTIVRKNITSLIDDTKGYDLGMFICEDERETELTYYNEPYEGWHAGLIYINNTEMSREFITCVESRVNNNLYDIEADEDEFSYVYKRTDGVSIKELSKFYKDTGPQFDVSSAVWSGQQEIKHTNEQYIEEFEKYVI